MAKSIHSTPYDGKWAVKQANKAKPLSTHRTQAAAIAAGRAETKRQHAEHVIHGRNGQIRKKNSYGNDPKRIKG
ncbi:MAG: DUF2188 domain-containing protein [Candidatus Kerfeldbacteria bacterium]|nr:DUF2188 domain-containing protein [Candidatus Kerfeldbacteria bacterium]